MPEVTSALLRQFSDAIVALVDQTVRSTAIVSGQTRALEDDGGSAWLYDPEHLVTNHHVIADLTEPIHVQLPGCAPQPAVIIGHDALTDLAVLRIDPKPLPRCVFRRPERNLASSASPSAAHSATSQRASASASSAA